jgi:outer membrane protein TolC
MASIRNGHPTGNNLGLAQAYDIRDIAAKYALSLEKTKIDGLDEQAARAQALRNLAQVWDTASERIRIIRGRPLPGSLRPKSLPPAKSKRQAAETRPGVDYAEPNGVEKPTVSIPRTEPVYPQGAE